MPNVKCPFCGSEAIFHFRRDSDYGGGQYYDTVNEESCYEGVRRYIPDVDVYHCRACDCFFDRSSQYPNVDVVTVSSLQAAIDNLESHIRWLTDNYKVSCRTVLQRIQKASPREMATTIPGSFPALENAYAEIEKLTEQVKLLSHIIEKHKISLPTIFSETQEEEAEE